MGKSSADRRTRRSFREWRRSRPFWGGLFFLLSGGELLYSSNMDLGGLQVHVGVEGFLSYLLPGLMLLCGLLLWFTPQQRIFYSVIGLGTALYSFIGLNLGGFFIGMLLGMVGGALAFAWSPVRLAAERVDDEPDLPEIENHTTVDSADHGSDNGVLPWSGAAHTPRHGVDEQQAAADPEAPRFAVPATDERPTNAERPMQQWPGRTLAMIAVPALLAAAVIAGALGNPRPAAASDDDGILPTPLVPAVIDILTGGDEATATPEPTATGEATPTAAPTTPVPTTGGATATKDAPATGSAPTTGSTSAPATTEAPETMDLPKTTPAVSAIAEERATLATSKLTITDLTYAGLAVLHTAKGAPVLALELRVTSLTAVKPNLKAPGAAFTADSLTINEATVFVTKISGMLGGAKVTITPDAVPLLGTEVTMTDVTTDLALIQGGTYNAPGSHTVFSN